MDIHKNDDVKLYMEAMTSEGSAVGHFDGMAVFVRGAVPGDTLLAHIIKVSKRYCIATVKEIITPSPHRVVSDCPVSAKCGGCSFREMTYAEELRYKEQRVRDALQRIGHLDVPVDAIVGAENTEHYRNKAQYPVHIENGVLTAGFYAYKSHRIIPCENCLLQPEVFGDCLVAFADWVKVSGVTAYDETTGRGLLRHLFLRRGAATKEIMACAVINGESIPNEAYLISVLTKIKDVKSICLNINKENSNVILGTRTKTVWGADTIKDILCGKTFSLSPNSFYQVNRDQCEKLYALAAEAAALTGGETVVDLYCGVGTIGLTMADKAKQLFGIEIVPQAIENAKKNAEQNGITNAEFFCGDAAFGAAQLQQRGIQPDVVILDPPRKGCSEDLLHTVNRMAPARIVYVSCDPATLARDMAILNGMGYTAVRVTPVDMFPRTPHVETVVQLNKS